MTARGVDLAGVLLASDAAIAGQPGVSDERAWARTGDAWEMTLRRTGLSAETVRVSQLDALVVRLEPHDWTARSFSAAWGAEFEPVFHERVEGLRIAVRAGRSSHGSHPLLILECAAGVMIVTVAWSGNWRIAIDEEGVLRAGVSPDDFFIDVAVGETVTAPNVLVSVGPTLAAAGSALTRAVGSLIPRTTWSDAMPTEWNHWWPYEDRDIDADHFLAEATLAASLGVEVATLDAGWFGSSSPAADWQAERGDWDLENAARFPGGIDRLSDDVRRTGVEFGIWIEAEALGAEARARRERPEIAATRSRPDDAPRITVSVDPRDPGFLGYVCLGSPDGRRFAADALDDLVQRTGARWVKLDFNVDPGSGCDREDHGHGAGDGLFRHYEGLYAVLDDFRERHPEVILESCSSGGLRLDVGIARHVHCHFLSDPDWTEHHLQVLWGASLMLPPAALLHWAWSQWRGDHPAQRRDLDSIEPRDFDRSLRAAMLHRTGLSMRLTTLSEPLRRRVACHIAAFRSHIAPLLVDGVLRSTTPQPLRGGGGCRQPAFQLDSSHGHLLAAFALDGLAEPVTLRLDGLNENTVYEVSPLADDEVPFIATGGDLMRGFARRGASWLWLAVERNERAEGTWVDQ
ncbi:alpha-galactosidase [Microbacterium sp. NPDC077663]|uniref:alpha-galactosidase n=1 Tax=Microbacterium sp. NPDC077663 TaxID=3364189 RepID=UPI0037CAF152